MNDVKRYSAVVDFVSRSERRMVVLSGDHDAEVSALERKQFNKVATLDLAIAALESENAKLRAGQEPVAWRVTAGNSHKSFDFLSDAKAARSAWLLAFPGGHVDAPQPLYTAPQPSAVPDDQQIMAKARELFGWAAGLGGFDDAVRDLVVLIGGHQIAPATVQGGSTANIGECACGSTEPHNATLGCIKAAGDAVQGVNRQLLEQVASEFEHDNDRYMLGRELRKILDAPRQPEGEGLEVVGVRVISDGFGSYIADSAMGIGALYPGDVREPLCRLSDAQRAIAELREEGERLRGELQQAYRQVNSECMDWAKEYERRKETQAERDTLRQQRDRLEEILRQIGDFAHDKSTGPAVPDALWEVRGMAYGAIGGCDD